MNYYFHLIVYFDIYLTLALSLNLLVGFCGLLTLAHAGYFAIGGYTYAVLAQHYGWGFVPAAGLGVGLAAVASLAISLPSWRLRGDLFVLATLAAQALIFSIIYNWSSPGAPLGSWANLTNGPFGIPGVPPPSVLGHSIQGRGEFVVFATTLAIVCGLLVWALTTSPWGRVVIALREDETALRELGKNTRLLKVQACAISCALAGLSGAVYASYVRFIDPSAASLDASILVLSMVIVGGLGTFRGPVVGTLILILLPELLRELPITDAQAASLRQLIYGLLLIILMHIRPQGLLGNYRLQ